MLLDFVGVVVGLLRLHLGRHCVSIWNCGRREFCDWCRVSKCLVFWRKSFVLVPTCSTCSCLLRRGLTRGRRRTLLGSVGSYNIAFGRPDEIFPGNSKRDEHVHKYQIQAQVARLLDSSSEGLPRPLRLQEFGFSKKGILLVQYKP
jgi:hypothetical protein